MQPNTPVPTNPTPTQSGNQNYGFIMQDQARPKRKLLPGNGGLLSKVLIISVGLIILLIVFNVLKNVISPPTSFSGFITVAQDQQEINHLLTQGLQQTSLSESTRSFALTAQLGITTDQHEVLTYLNGNKQKVKAKVLNTKVSTKTDATLGAASTPATYDSTFREIMKAQLATYQKDLKNTFANFKGQKGRKILDKAYTNSQLLSTKLEIR